MKSGTLKVAVDARVLGLRGVGRYLANLLEAIAQTNEDVALRLYLGGASDERAVPTDARFSVERLHGVHPAWAEQILIPRRARAWGAELLHYPDNTAALKPGLPMVLTLHDTLWRRPLGQAIAAPTRRQRMQDRYRKWVCPRAARAAERVITVSRHSYRDIAATLGVEPGRLRMIPEGLDRVFLNPLSESRARRLVCGLGLRRAYVLASGAADRRKNIDRLIEAFAWARRRDSRLGQAELAITSLRPGEAATTTYLATARAAGVESCVKILPYVSDVQMKALYQRALCFAFPSLWEGFGLPLLEAFSMGCPVLAARAAALPEVAGRGALYADPLDVESLGRGLVRAASPLGRAGLLARARAQGARFSWRRSAAAHLRAFREAVAVNGLASQ